MSGSPIRGYHFEAGAFDLFKWINYSPINGEKEYKLDDSSRILSLLNIPWNTWVINLSFQASETGGHSSGLYY